MPIWAWILVGLATWFVVSIPASLLVAKAINWRSTIEPEEVSEAWRVLVIKSAETMVNFGLLTSVIGQYPDHVREGLVERMSMLSQQLDQEVEIIQGFGEAFDE